MKALGVWRARRGGEIAWGNPLLGVLTSVAAVAVVTAAIYLVKPFVPVLSLGVLYVFAVLPIAIGWGLAYAMPVSVASMLAFNWFHLPPVHTFTLAERTNWFALAVYLATAVVVSELATRARRRAAEAEQRQREAALLADVALGLLEGRDLGEELERIASRAAEVLGVPTARIELGAGGDPPPTESPHPLSLGGRTIGTLYTQAGFEPNLAASQRFLPALVSLLTVAVDSERLRERALEAEALRRSDAVKTAVLRTVSHDLRSPLTAISAAVGGLESPSLAFDEADRAGLLQTIRLEAKRLERLVDNLLDLSRLQAGAAAPTPELWPVDELIAQALEHVRESERVRLALPPDPPPVRVDAAQIQRALANLIENALRFGPPGTPVYVRATVTRKDLIVRVVDQGPGIGEDDLELVFEPFHRGPDAGTGSGLGLAIARGFAEANGARVWAESRPGQGASFALALPLVETPVPASL